MEVNLTITATNKKGSAKKIKAKNVRHKSDRRFIYYSASLANTQAFIPSVTVTGGFQPSKL